MRPSGTVGSLIGTLIAVTLLAGCGGGGGLDDRDRALAVLQDRATADQAADKYESIIQSLSQALTQQAGIGPWAKINNGDRAGCSEFGDIGALPAQTIFTPGWVARGPLDDGTWSQAVEVIRAHLIPLGFHEPETIGKDDPRVRGLVMSGPDNSLFSYDQMDNATMRITSGCHLTEEGMRSLTAEH